MLDKHQENPRKELGERIKDVTTKVVAGLRKAGHEVETVPCAMLGGVKCEAIRKVDGVFVRMNMKAQQRSGRGGWHIHYIHYNGKLTMSLGSYPDTKSYPEPKAGFDIAKTVERIQEHVARKKRANEADAKRKEAIEATKSVADQMQEVMDKYLGAGEASVSYTYRGNNRHGIHRPETARDFPAVTIEMDLLEAQAVAALLGSMRIAEAEAYGDDDGQAGAESGVEGEGT